MYALSNLPNSLTDRMPLIVRHVAHQTKLIVSAKAENQSVSTADEWDSVASDSEQELEDYEDVKNSVSQKFMQRLNKMSEEDDEDDDDDEGATDGSLRVSPLDEINELEVLKQTLKAVPQHVQAMIALWLGSADVLRLDEILSLSL